MVTSPEPVEHKCMWDWQQVGVVEQMKLVVYTLVRRNNDTIRYKVAIARAGELQAVVELAAEPYMPGEQARIQIAPRQKVHRNVSFDTVVHETVESLLNDMLVARWSKRVVV